MGGKDQTSKEIATCENSVSPRICCEQAAAGMLRAFPVHFVPLQSNSTHCNVHSSRAASENCMKCDISPWDEPPKWNSSLLDICHHYSVIYTRILIITLSSTPDLLPSSLSHLHQTCCHHHSVIYTRFLVIITQSSIPDLLPSLLVMYTRLLALIIQLCTPDFLSSSSSHVHQTSCRHHSVIYTRLLVNITQSFPPDFLSSLSLLSS